MSNEASINLQSFGQRLPSAQAQGIHSKRPRRVRLVQDSLETNPRRQSSILLDLPLGFTARKTGRRPELWIWVMETTETAVPMVTSYAR